MKIEVNLEKKYFFGIIAVMLVLAGAIFAYASYSNPIPNPGHGADTVWVNVSGAEMNLQEAINQGKIGGFSISGLRIGPIGCNNIITNATTCQTLGYESCKAWIFLRSHQNGEFYSCSAQLSDFTTRHEQSDKTTRTRRKLALFLPRKKGRPLDRTGKTSLQVRKRLIWPP